MQNLTERAALAITLIKEDRSLARGITDADLAKILGTNENTLAAYRKGKGLLKGEVLEKLVQCYNISPEWLFKGVGEPFPGARNNYPEICGPEIRNIICEASACGEFLYIPQITGRISAGEGLEPDDRVDVRIAFRSDWLKRKGDPSRMILVKVSGDSMEPTLYSGDLVLIDRSRNYIDGQGGIYAIDIHNEIMIKRIHIVLPDDKVQIISDNPKYQVMKVETSRINIDGKVIWFGREIER